MASSKWRPVTSREKSEQARVEFVDSLYGVYEVTYLFDRNFISKDFIGDLHPLLSLVGRLDSYFFLIA
jgi:hypothetical protein